MTKELTINNRIIAEATNYINIQGTVTKTELAHRLGIKSHTSQLRRVLETLESRNLAFVRKHNGRYVIS